MKAVIRWLPLETEVSRYRDARRMVWRRRFNLVTNAIISLLLIMAWVAFSNWALSLLFF